MPPFYFPGGKPVSEDVRVSAQAKIDAFFEIYPDGLTIPAVKELVKEVSLPTEPSQSVEHSSLFVRPAMRAGSHQAWVCPPPMVCCGGHAGV